MKKLFLTLFSTALIVALAFNSLAWGKSEKQKHLEEFLSAQNDILINTYNFSSSKKQEITKYLTDYFNNHTDSKGSMDSLSNYVASGGENYWEYIFRQIDQFIKSNNPNDNIISIDYKSGLAIIGKIQKEYYVAHGTIKNYSNKTYTDISVNFSVYNNSSICGPAYAFCNSLSPNQTWQFTTACGTENWNKLLIHEVEHD